MTNWTRRNFIKTSGIAGGTLATLPSFSLNSCKMKTPKSITIEATNSNFEREPLIRPFGFKGGYMSEIWQTAAWMKSASGYRKVGLCTQSVLWSDAKVFASFSESGGNSMMYAMSEYALKILKGKSFTSPVELLDEILDEVYSYGQKISDNQDLRKTFALNALVGVDNAAWLLFAAENKITSFDDMIPEEYRPALSHQHKTVASIPLMAYSIPISEIKQAADDGYFFMKIKIGQPGTQEEMLEKDKARLTEIHKAIGHYRTEHSEDGKLPYYFDANGRYEKKETLLKLLNHAKKIGAFDQIAIIEEPFPEHADIDVSDIPVRLAADESAHTDEDALIRIQMGYKAIALKAIAKTLSMTMKIANLAKQNEVPCFCADLTVNPILVDWNKAVASRLDPFPGLGTGLLETNGHQNYKNWAEMESYHPYTEAEWRKTKNGVFELGSDYYEKSGGVLTDSEHYLNMFQKH
ncbi:twin-arginine translocation signal domain-containing protein [Draconibacterium sp.]|nr:twin-arginine translocation signal domain-containing protein [Draconibacterium sp.]